MRVSLEVNGRKVEPDAHPGETLMELLRRLGYVSVKNGCDHGDCGSCAVLLDGRAVTSCLLFAAQAGGHRVITVEGVAEAEGLHPLQQTLLDAGGVQCGFCTPGIVIAALDLFARTPDPSEDDIRLALAGNLCRCTGYGKIVEAVQDAAARLRETAHAG